MRRLPFPSFSRLSQLVAWMLLGLLLATSAFAHRLDEYLQATTFTLEKDRISLQIRLVPGTEVFHALFDTVDADRNGRISPSEESDYTERVRRDLSLSIDGRPLTLAQTSARFPAVKSMEEGLGEIILTFEARTANDRGRHTLTFSNAHEKDRSVYLVNCFLPRDPALKIVNQSRNESQSLYALAFVVGEAP